MFSILLNLLLPFAFNVIRAYQNSPSNENDGKLLNAVKSSAHYLACQDNNTLNFGHVCVLDKTVSFQNSEDLNNAT